MSAKRAAPFVVYLLHFDGPYDGNKRHYIGHTNNLARRLKEHSRAQGRIGRAAKRLILVWVVRTVHARTRGAAMRIEYRWKRKGARALCARWCRT